LTPDVTQVAQFLGVCRVLSQSSIFGVKSNNRVSRMQ
jgi:hypothetical protein